MSETFSSYLSGHDLTFAEFGRSINASRMAVRHWTMPKGHPARRLPSEEMMIAIYVETAGAVTPNDFYALPDLGAMAAAETPAPEEVA